MKKKNRRMFINSILAIIGILALAGLIFSLYAIIYTFIYDNKYAVLGVSSAILTLTVFFGATSWKKIKSKIKDIFT